MYTRRDRDREKRRERERWLNTSRKREEKEHGGFRSRSKRIAILAWGWSWRNITNERSCIVRGLERHIIEKEREREWGRDRPRNKQRERREEKDRRSATNGCPAVHDRSATSLLWGQQAPPLFMCTNRRAVASSPLLPQALCNLPAIRDSSCLFSHVLTCFRFSGDVHIVDVSSHGLSTSSVLRGRLVDFSATVSFLDHPQP